MSENKTIALAMVTVLIGLVGAILWSIEITERRREKCAAAGAEVLEIRTSYLCVLPDGRIVKP
jgi:hypothetical protein